MKYNYISSGWFDSAWLQEVEDIKHVLEVNGLQYFSPKDYAVAAPTANLDTQEGIFQGNVRHLNECDWMICNTRGKDPGSIFEAGAMYAKGKPIVYFCAGLPPGAKFNLMLSRSGVKVCTSIAELDDYLSRCVAAGHLLVEPYGGIIE